VFLSEIAVAILHDAFWWTFIDQFEVIENFSSCLFINSISILIKYSAKDADIHMFFIHKILNGTLTKATGRVLKVNKKDGYRQPNVRQFLSFCNQPKAHFGLSWVRPWDNCGKCHMDEKRIQCLSNASDHIPIYLQPFPSNSTRKFKSSPF